MWSDSQVKMEISVAGWLAIIGKLISITTLITIKGIYMDILQILWLAGLTFITSKQRDICEDLVKEVFKEK